MVRHGVMNSRMKDFWDIRLLSRQFDFDGKTLATAIAIAETFSKRHTDIPADPIAFTETFMRDETKAAQWKAFLRKNRMTDGADTFAEAVHAVSVFLKPGY